jgi:hypothetical protein
MAGSMQHKGNQCRLPPATATAALFLKTRPPISAAPSPLCALALPFQLAPPGRVDSVTQSDREGRIDPKERLLDIFDQANVHPVRQDIILIEKANEGLEERRDFLLLQFVDKQPAIDLSTGEPDPFQERNLAPI